MVKKIVSLIAAAALVSSAAAIDAKAFSVDQIQAEMPDLSLYVSSDSEVTKDNIEVMLDYKSLSIENVQNFSESGQSINYFFLIDDSGSVPYNQMEALKRLLGSMDQYVRADDTIELISIGQLKTLYSGKGVTDEYRQAVTGLVNNQQETYLYEALSNVSDTILSQSSGNDVRNVVIAFSDGFNEAVGMTSYSEITDALREAGVPLYAMGITSTDNSGLEQFGELARSTGGDMYTFEPETCDQIYADLDSKIKNCYLVTAKADNNIISGERTVVVNYTPEDFSKEYKIEPKKWVPDTEAPTLTKLEKTGSDQLKVTFSESVLSADSVKNYDLRYDGKSVDLKNIAYSEENGKYTAKITASEDLISGKYELSVSGITDNSNEKNAVSNSVSAEIEGVEPATEALIISGEDDSSSSALIWIIIIAAVILLAGLGVLIFFLMKKKNEPEPVIAPPGGDRVENSSIKQMGQNVKHHVMIEGMDSGAITLLISSDDGAANEIKLTVNGSLSVGRSTSNDLYFDDINMSRSHFVIDKTSTGYFIRDCGSMSGTYLNGQRLEPGSAPLNPGDTISAGRTKMTIRW